MFRALRGWQGGTIYSVYASFASLGKIQLQQGLLLLRVRGLFLLSFIVAHGKSGCCPLLVWRDPPACSHLAAAGNRWLQGCVWKACLRRQSPVVPTKAPQRVTSHHLDLWNCLCVNAVTVAFHCRDVSWYLLGVLTWQSVLLLGKPMALLGHYGTEYFIFAWCCWKERLWHAIYITLGVVYPCSGAEWFPQSRLLLFFPREESQGPAWQGARRCLSEAMSVVQGVTGRAACQKCNVWHKPY